MLDPLAVTIGNPANVAIALPAVFTKYVTGVPDLHLPGYIYPPYRDTIDFRYDVHNTFYQTRIGTDFAAGS
jgi:hypothetical protein